MATLPEAIRGGALDVRRRKPTARPDHQGLADALQRRILEEPAETSPALRQAVRQRGGRDVGQRRAATLQTVLAIAGTLPELSAVRLRRVGVVSHRHSE